MHYDSCSSTSGSSAGMSTSYGQNSTALHSNLGQSSSSANGWRSTSHLGRPHLPPTPTASASTRPCKCLAVNSLLTLLMHTLCLAVRFKNSPFHTIERPLAEITQLSEVRDSQSRGTGTVSFNITVEERAAISAGTHQARLYCTSGHFYSSGISLGSVCLIEFPGMVDIRVNGTIITGANTRGLKKKAGTAPPVDLSKLVRVGQNRIDFTYVNNTTPFQPKVSPLLHPPLTFGPK